MNLKPFGDVFRERLDRIETEARKVGLNFTSICEQAGISRATPDRWRRKLPKTVELVETMEKIIANKRAELDAARGIKRQDDE